MNQWEYFILNTRQFIKSGEELNEIDNLGEAGWELVTSVGMRLYFKRPKAAHE